MSELKEELYSKALSLSPIEKAELIESLIASFDFHSRDSIDELWAKEVESRLDAYEQGDIEAIPAKRVFEKSRKTFEVMNVSFLSPAEKEFEEAIDYYNMQSEELGFKFAAEVKRTNR